MHQNNFASSASPGTLEDIATIHERRLTTIVEGVSGSAKSISAWLSTLGADGKWPDSEVNYASGCDGQRANWPAQEHWQRISTMAAAWHGGLPNGTQYVNDSKVADGISLAMDYWFANDFTNLACLDSGGTASCPCGTPGLWNLNWFSNIILIPELVSQTCLLLNDTLTATQSGNCSHITLRAYGTFDRYVNGLGYLTGANTLDVAKIGIDQGLLAVNVSLIADAYKRVHETVVIEQDVKADGIRVDGSFSQHAGVLYNGNYGKDFTNDVLNLETEAGGTQFAAGDVSKSAFATLFDGDKWMIYRNVHTNVLHWDFSVLGRFISFPVADNQATGSIKINISQVQELGEQWQSDTLLNFYESLSKNTSNANAGELTGNRMFFDSDYMVTRGPGYVTSLKMYSNRTLNTECVNSQNLLGFHLSDGVTYTYLEGNEYEDIAAAWDWNLIPGSTVDYNATPLSCDTTEYTGLEAFVGGVSNGQVGAAAMRYKNPQTQALSWQKAWFFLDDDVQHVMISHISSNSDAPVFSVLDQRRHVGGVWIDGTGTRGGNFSAPKTLWHGNVGYKFPPSEEAFSLSVETGNKTGNWSSIGTSTKPPANVDLFAAWIDHTDTTKSVSYTVYPGTDYGSFVLKQAATQLENVVNDHTTSAVYDHTHSAAMGVFWHVDGGSFTFTPDIYAPISITSNGNAALIYRLDSGNVTVSDPSQTLSEVTITMSIGDGLKPPGWGEDNSITLSFPLPDSGAAGDSVSQVLNH
ncbi:polysaccharide lyase family 8 protein [Hygrophoropsis aurantiaca]|uniref:Polysaccharide lyase family 8 protein n=1 Tax=Hygrophoropsis aurantiaca TaxID=72124 RepID=A0ACB8ASP5_9AGAM|nr:polysaccharide lyase family 8 protein [Hygrophoropsis aurantiaca]